MTTQNEIFKVLVKAKSPLTRFQLQQATGYNNTRSFMAVLSTLVKRGLLTTNGRETCKHCGSCHTLYGVSDEGRLNL